MPPEICAEHLKLIENRAKTDADLSIIKNDVSYIRNKVCKHVEEGEREGGHRDILRENTKDIAYLKKQIDEIKKSKWQSGVISGVVVYVLINIPEIGHLLISLITKLAFAGQ